MIADAMLLVFDAFRFYWQQRYKFGAKEEAKISFHRAIDETVYDFHS
jgi:hypothetical protein